MSNTPKAIRSHRLCVAIFVALCSSQAMAQDPKATADQESQTKPSTDQSTAPAANAAAEGPEELDSIIVTGIRRSLEQAVDIKRESKQIIDVITAEDVGKLPDNNVAEALQRVTGVQITRVFQWTIAPC
jgi:outer membrane cobalamin receptor